MSLDILEKPKTTGTDEGDHDRFSHYVPKKALEAAIFSGVPATAICGKKWLPNRDPQRYPVCPDCKALYETMRDE